jgi:aspartyl protease family protein
MAPRDALRPIGSTMRRTKACLAASLLALLALAPAPSMAQAVALTGVVGSRALIVVDGGDPRMVAAGETHQGVKVISAQSDQAVVEIGGKRVTLRMGEAPVSVGGGIPAGQGTRIVLPLGSGGHFMASGQINGRPVQFMVDTGATAVAIGSTDAQRLGISTQSAQPIRLNTANGQSIGYLVRLDSVRINDVEVFGVQAIVASQPMPYVLLGNTFLQRFSMRRESDQMVLERRY